MGELLACFQGLASIIPEWYGSWEELSYDIINNIYVPDYVINEDTGEFVVLNRHFVQPWMAHPNITGTNSDHAYVMVRIGGLWRLSGDIYGLDIHGHPRSAGDKEEAHRLAIRRNQFWQKYDERAKTYRHHGMAHSVDQRYIVLPASDPRCYRCNHVLTKLSLSELDHNGMRHRMDCDEG